MSPHYLFNLFLLPAKAFLPNSPSCIWVFFSDFLHLIRVVYMRMNRDNVQGAAPLTNMTSSPSENFNCLHCLVLFWESVVLLAPWPPWHHDGMSESSVLCRFFTRSHFCCVFLNATAMPCPKDCILQRLFPSLHSFCPLFCNNLQVLEGWLILMSHWGFSTQ